MKKIKNIIIILILVITMTGCASFDRGIKDIKSDFKNGLNREINVYSYNGELIASYKGKIDIEENESKVLFELKGKRYIYYNAIVEVIEK